MVIFKVKTGIQVRYFEATSYVAAVQQALSAQLPTHAVKAGTFFDQVELRGSDSKAQALLDSL